MSPAKRFPLLLLPVIAFLAIALCRILGPSDLYDKEQPRTISYTADMLLHHRWILPTDNFDIPATKPPLFNWLEAPIVAILGYHEWTLKLPSLLAVAIVLLCIHHAAKSIATSTPGITAITATTLSTLASLMWLSSFMTAKLMYLARPDMFVVACLTVAWVTAADIINHPKPRPVIPILLWLSITAAALAKGPIALLPIVYLLLAARLITHSWQPLKCAGFWWGIPLLLASFGTWCLLAYNQHPEFFRKILLDREITQRLLPSNNTDIVHRLRWLITLPNGPIYIITRFLPWSLLPLAILILVAIKYFSTTPRPAINYRHPLAPAILWIIVITLSFCLLSSHRPDRYAPIFPPLALITASLALRLIPRFRLSLRILIASTFAFIVVVIVNNQFFDFPATKGVGDNLIHFSHEVAQKTANDTILFEDGEQTPLQTLLGRHQSVTPSAEYLNAANWVIRFYDPSAPVIPVLISDPIDQIDGPDPGKLALYPLLPGQAVAEFEHSKTIPRVYSDEESRRLLSIPDPATSRWLQFWRQHTVPATTQ